MAKPEQPNLRYAAKKEKAPTFGWGYCLLLLGENVENLASLAVAI